MNKNNNKLSLGTLTLLVMCSFLTQTANSMNKKSSTKPAIPSKGERAFARVGKDKIENKWSQLDCPICIEKFTQTNTNLTQLPCKHILHQDCISEWLLNKDIINNSYNNTCPFCKKELSQDYIEKYFISVLNKKRGDKEFKQKLLFLAAEQGYINLLSILLKKEFTVDVNQQIDAVVYSYVDDNGDNIQTKEPLSTPLHTAARYSDKGDPKKKLATIKLLVENGANLAAIDGSNSRPCKLIPETMAEIFDYLAPITCLKLINEEYANKELMKDILYLCVRYGYLEVLEKLIANKIIDVNLTDDEGKTPLHFAVDFYRDNEHNREKSLKIIKLLIEKGKAKFTTKDTYGNRRPIDYLINDKNSDGYKYLSDKTEEYLLNFIPNNKGNATLMKTILFDSAEHGYYKVLEKLITNKIIDVNITGKLGRTPLAWAVLFCNQDPEKGLKIIKLLVEKGKANLNAKAIGGNKPIAFIKNANSDGYKYLAAKTEEHLEEALLKEISDKSNDKELMKTILFDAAHYGYIKRLEKLIADKIIDVNTTGKHGETPLEWAAYMYNKNPEKYLTIIKILVEKGNAKVDPKNIYNQKPIDFIDDKNSEGYKYLAHKEYLLLANKEYILLKFIPAKKSNTALIKHMLFSALSQTYLKVQGWCRKASERLIFWFKFMRLKLLAQNTNIKIQAIVAKQQ